MLRSLVVLAALAGCARAPVSAKSPASSTKTPAAIGETFTIESRILGERRVINVYVPPDYAKSDERFPVLYMPDGGLGEDFPHVVGSVDVSIKNAVIRPLIVVGVENTERRRDLVAETSVDEEKKVAPHAGGADKFRAFLRDELKPLIAKRYRVTSESALIGESLAGLFVLETFLVEPTLFDGYISADPSVWWNEQTLVRGANEQLAWWSAGPKQVYIATADYKETQDAIATLLTALRLNAPAGVTWTYEPMPMEHHSTIFPTAALRGIRTLFAAPTPDT
ncbi:MAG: alpha/beta hydrolase [Kofleriaceae bacterium]|nr:alpha/beta hydrolase [Kofleriaceae bacterium]